MLAEQVSWPKTNVRQLHLPQWRKLAENSEDRFLIPLTKFAQLTPDKRFPGNGPVSCEEDPSIPLEYVAARGMDGACRLGHPCPMRAPKRRAAPLLG